MSDNPEQVHDLKKGRGGSGKEPGGAPPVPSTLQQAFVALVWTSRRRWLWGVVLGLAVAAFAFWQSVPDADKSRVLTQAVDVFFTAGTKADLKILPLAVTDPDDQEVAWLRTKLERKLAEFFSESGLRVSHSLTPISVEAASDFVLSGSVSRRGDQFSLQVSLQENDVFVTSAHLEAEFSVLEDIYSQFAKALVYGMDIDPHTLKRLDSQSRPTESATSYALYLEAQKAASGRDRDRAISLLDIATQDDPAFAMAYWAKGELFKLSGELQREKEFKEHAADIDKDHPRIPISLNFSNPMPALLEHSLKSDWMEVAEGLTVWSVDLPDHHLSLHAWKFSRTLYEIGVGLQLGSHGSTTRQIRMDHDAILAINGGFFEIDAEDRLWPSGLLIVAGKELHSFAESAGSGLLYWTEETVGIDWSRNHKEHLGATSVIQSGPLLVDPGGGNGIYRNDYDRRKRSAVCLAGDRIVFLSVGGEGLSLYELGDFLSRRPDQGGIGCERALNLDGGASTQVSFSFDDLAVEIEGTWNIHNAAIVKLK